MASSTPTRPTSRIIRGCLWVQGIASGAFVVRANQATSGCKQHMYRLTYGCQGGNGCPLGFRAAPYCKLRNKL